MSQLDVFLYNNPNMVSHSYVDSSTHEKYSQSGRLLSVHKAFTSMIEHVWINELTRTNNPQNFAIFNFSKSDTESLQLDIQKNHFWSEAYCYSNVEVLLDTWYTWIYQKSCKFVPRITKHRRKLPPWISNETSNLSKHKTTAEKRQNRKPTDSNKLKYENLELAIQEGSLADQANFEVKKAGQRSFSDIQKYYTCLRKSGATPSCVNLKSETATDDVSKANLFNKFFISVYHSKSASTVNEIAADHVPKLSKVKIETNNIRELMVKLKEEKAGGPDGLPNRVLKKFSAELAPSVASLFNTFQNEGEYPSAWKRGSTFPIFKKGDERNVENYSPITLLSALSKVFERCIFNQLYEHVGPYISNCQFDFRAKRSAVLQLLTFVDEIYSSLDDAKVKQLHACYIDFEKAFDKVCHSTLLTKLRNIGIGGRLYKLLESYLTDRRQITVDGSAISGSTIITSGVLQGSILGPLLFLIYFKSLYDAICYSWTYAFADD